MFGRFAFIREHSISRRPGSEAGLPATARLRVSDLRDLSRDSGLNETPEFQTTNGIATNLSIRTSSATNRI